MLYLYIDLPDGGRPAILAPAPANFARDTRSG